jgi:hypothetical protein
LPDRTEVVASVYGTSLHVFVAGPAYSIAECGEQLGWLVSSLLAPDDWRGQVANCTAVITPSSHPVIDKFAASLDRWNQASVCFDINTVVLPSNTALPVSGETLGRDIAIVHGFPTPRRPGLGPGLEFSLDVAIQFLGTSSPTIKNTRVVMEGHRRTLELVGQVDDVFLWHDILPHTRASTSLEGFISSYRRDTGVNFDLGQLSKGRHILGQPDLLVSTKSELQYIYLVILAIDT